jgi:DhnA family fructose-bisphosphate aldolase class Ia
MRIYMGKERRLKRIFRDDGKTVIVPMDHSVTTGPIKGLIDMQRTVDSLKCGYADAILGPLGYIIASNGICHLSHRSAILPSFLSI